MLVETVELIKKAQRGGYAVGAFNTLNLEYTQGILEAAKNLHSPLVIQVTETTLNFAGGRTIFALIKNLAEHYTSEVPVAMHLDHGKTFETIKRAIAIGFTSVMYDVSRKDYKDNLKETKEVADYCHSKGVAVQGELGNVPYLYENHFGKVEWDLYMTDPAKVEEFVEKTGIDTLAIAIGNAHGFFKERETPDWERLKKIRGLVKIPLILHGASDWEREKAFKAIEGGINCFNIDTSLRMAFVARLGSIFRSDIDPSIDPRKIMGEAREAIKIVVEEKIRNLKSWNKI